jgi:hypothetical protein
MKQIHLVNSPFKAIVDDKNYERLCQHQWYLHESGYVWRYHGNEYTFMHHDVIGYPPDGLHTDHINRNKFDNYESNLRFITRSVSMQNRDEWNKWGLRGVTQQRNNRNWIAKIQFNGKRIYLGTFKTKEEAARAYDKMALTLYGQDAALNYVIEKGVGY